ncbi:MAG: nitrite reductase, partial [Bacteroidota bacterium]
GFMDLVHEEWTALKNKTFKIDTTAFNFEEIPANNIAPQVKLHDAKKYSLWLLSNVFEQKQKGFYGVQLRVELGDFKAPVARKLAALVSEYAADDIRMTVNQGILLKFVRKENLPYLFNELDKLNLANPGFNTIADITACPGTDTCALGVTNSTGLAQQLEATIQEEYPHLLTETKIKIKISGCMNSCGQHSAANIGFHGSSIKKRPLVIPAMQVVLGGGVSPEGNGFIAEKVTKVPTKRVPDVLRALLNDYEENGLEGEYFNDYYYRLGKRYFYDLLKPLAGIQGLEGSDFFDWGQDHEYRQQVGVGECAGVMIDVIGTIIQDASDKITFAKEALAEGIFADAIYHAYAAFVVGAKAMLLSEDVKCNTHKKILSDFQAHFIETGNFALTSDFPEQVLRINKNEPSEAFAKEYIADAAIFIEKVIATRTTQLESTNGVDKEVVADYYKA